MPEPPRHYARLKKGKRCRGSPAGMSSGPQSLSAEAFRQQMEQRDTVVIDTRSMLAFGGGHIPGAINIGLESSFFPPGSAG